MNTCGGWPGRSRSTRRPRRNQRGLPRPAVPLCRPRPCCPALRSPRPNRFQLAHPVTPFPRVMTVSRPAATIPRAGRVTITGRITATAIPSTASPVSAVAAAPSTASPDRTVSAASTVSWVSTMQLGSAVSAPGADIWVALAGGNCSGTVNLFGRGQPDLRDWASYVGVLPAWSPNLAEWSPISKSRRCQADNETHGYDDRPDPLGRDAETAKQRYIVGS